MIKEFFDIQDKHDKRFIDFDKFNNDRKYRIQVVKNRILDLFDQTAKLLNCFGWKKHKFFNNEDDFVNIKQQLIDVQKYLIGLANILGITPEEYIKLFLERSKVMELIWDNKNKFAFGDVVVIFDIDGVVLDYNKEYELFLSVTKGLKKNKEFRNEYSYHIKYGITKTEEEVLYKEFIMSGGFTRLKIYDGMLDLFKWIYRCGLKIALISARPVWQYSRIIDDTYLSLLKNCLHYDMVVFNKDKADAIVQRVYPAKVICFVEDRDKHAIEISQLGINVLLIEKDYNKMIPFNGVTNIKRISENNSNMEIREFIFSKLKE